MSCVLWAYSPEGHASDAIVYLNPSHPSVSLGRQLRLLEDPSGNLTYSGAYQAAKAGAFRPVSQTPLQVGYTNSAYWLYFVVVNTMDDASVDLYNNRFFLSINYPLLDSIEFNLIKGDTHITLVEGDLLPFGERLLNLNIFAFPFTLAPGESAELLIRVQSTSSVLVPMRVETEAAFISNRFINNTLEGVYLGITLGLGLYNLFLWVSLRNRAYGYYVLMVITIMFFNTGITGFTYRLWPEATHFQQINPYFWSFASSITVVLFGMEFLQTRVSTPRLHKVLQVLIGLAIVQIPLLWLVTTPMAAKMTVIQSSACAVVLLWAAATRLVKGFRPAIYYLLGQGSIIVSVLFTSITSQKLLPLYHLAPIILRWCSAFELVLFSVGLAGIIHGERRLREQAQRESSEAQKALLESQIKRNQDLDELVKVRTQELESANEQLREMNTRDELTGLHNRRYLNENLDAEYRRALRENEPISVLMLDIDHFKAINDSFGHQFGDYCLQEAGRRLRAVVQRPSDMAVRYGGEEFLVVLPNTSLESASKLGEKLRQAFAQKPFKFEGQHCQVTLSVGVACDLPEAPDQHELLLRRADECLYQAKALGRNRVEWQQQEITIIP